MSLTCRRELQACGSSLAIIVPLWWLLGADKALFVRTFTPDEWSVYRLIFLATLSALWCLSSWLFLSKDRHMLTWLVLGLSQGHAASALAYVVVVEVFGAGVFTGIQPGMAGAVGDLLFSLFAAPLCLLGWLAGLIIAGVSRLSLALMAGTIGRSAEDRT